jgi:pilus assembly protein Flp/PilA
MLSNVLKQIKALTRDEDGAVAVEYALIGALVAIGLVTALTGLKTGISTTLGNIVTALTT